MKYNKCKVCNGSIKQENTKYKQVCCESCYLVFSEKKYTNEELIDLYDKLYNDTLMTPKYSNHSVDEYEDIKNNKINIGYNIRRIINKYIKKNRKVLEIGFGIGLVGFYLKKHKTSDFLGIEIDNKTKSKALKLGVQTINGDFSSIAHLKNKYDVIMPWEVLEHLQDLSLFFELASNRLKNKGLLMFSVPNYNKRLNYKNSKNNIYQSGPPVHLNFFTKKSIKIILEKYNFRTELINEKKFHI